MALTLNAEQKSILQIFSGENQYIIPPYQRAYSWTNVQCKALFEDIKKAFYTTEQEGYFLGNIVLAKSREERNRLEVIDGQQRLTSLTLILKVLLSFDKENKDLYNAIWIKDRRTDKEIQRLETNVFMEKDFNYFREVLAFDFSTDVCSSVKKEDNLFKQNICYFYNELKEFSKHNDILKFADFLLDYIYILPIETEDSNADKARKNALQVFETINNRGLNLATSDIFKARLYSMALNELEHNIFIEKWKKLSDKCDNLDCSIDNIFEIYRDIIRYENNQKWEDIKLTQFFLEKKEYSPFFSEDYKTIINNLLKICDFTIFFIDIAQNPNKHEELSKYFQVIHQGILRVLFSNDLYSFFYKCDLDDYSNLLETAKKMIFTNKKIQKIVTRDKELSLIFLGIEFNSLNSIDEFFLLLTLSLDKTKKAIYPYYFIKKGLITYNTADKNRITIDFLIKLNSELEDNEKCVDLINQTYKFIREANEN